MDYEQFASDLPRQRTFVFASVEENEETMRRLGVNQQVRQLGPGEFHCDMVVREREQATLFVDRFNKACSLYLEPPANSVGLLVFRSAGGRWLASGNSVANDKLVVLPRGSGTDLVAPDLMGSEAITIPESRFIELSEALCPAFVRPERMAVIEGNTAQLHVLRKAVVDLVAEPESHAIEERLSNLLALWITWMGDSRGNRSTDLTVNEARVRVAKLAQEFIEEHYREAVRIEDLCRVTGVGVRTLQRHFRRYFDVTISDYVKTLRLDAAHRELSAAAEPSRDTVAAIGLRHGFSHLGRFSGAFRERFGESPRKTLATPNRLRLRKSGQGSK